jgi:hypothetical protein
VLCSKEIGISEAVHSQILGAAILRTQCVCIIKTSDGKVLSYIYVHVHVKCALYLSDLIQDWNVSTD